MYHIHIQGSDLDIHIQARTLIVISGSDLGYFYPGVEHDMTINSPIQIESYGMLFELPMYIDMNGPNLV